MKAWSSYGLQNIKDTEQLARFVTQAITNLSQILDKRVGFNDNIDCQVINDVSLVTGQENSVVHNLNKIPIGYLIISRSANAVIYDGSNNWTEKQIFLNTSANVTVSIVILGA